MKRAHEKAGNKHSLPVKKKEFEEHLEGIEAFFSYASHSQAKEILWDWLAATVTGRYNKEMGFYERASIITMYEHIVQLVDAAGKLNEHWLASKKK